MINTVDSKTWKKLHANNLKTYNLQMVSAGEVRGGEQDRNSINNYLFVMILKNFEKGGIQ